MVALVTVCPWAGMSVMTVGGVVSRATMTEAVPWCPLALTALAMMVLVPSSRLTVAVKVWPLALMGAPLMVRVALVSLTVPLMVTGLVPTVVRFCGAVMVTVGTVWALGSSGK